MHLFLEVFTVVAFLLAVTHAVARRGTDGAWLVGSLFALGFVRENFVQLVRYLYAFAPLTLRLGAAPAIAAVIWSYSIYVAVDWAEGLRRDPGQARRPTARFLALVALFMIALACFYEPFLGRVGMARWEEGTKTTAGVPWIALVGYPTLTVPFLLIYAAVLRRWQSTGPRLAAFAVGVVVLALVHAAGLQALKDALHW